jgi:hypothetical protein
LEHSPVTISLLKEEEQCQNQLQGALRKEEENWRLKSHCLWLQVGDKNSSFFYKQCKVRKGMNMTKEIQLESQSTLTSFEEIKKTTSAHFDDLYNEKELVDINLRDQALTYIPQIVSERDNEEISKRVNEEEILSALWKFGSDKAPRPDGFTAHFYKKNWHIIKFDLARMIQYVKKSCRMGGAINFVFPNLIPKERNGVSFSRFRPISSCNVS